MRFAELELEHYGRFEKCRLTFKDGQPDFHIIFGVNEAGKSTTVAAISDLLFGFPTRTDYAFRFDTPLLRVGAIIEEAGQRFAFRRKKGNKATVVDSNDAPIDETRLVAMMHGQGRPVFHVGWSLDHQRLREGGQAIVTAKDDLGQALFAAGSGLTAIAEVQRALEGEIDQIWGKRASEKRLYSRVERDLKDAERRLKEAQLRPADWKSEQATLVRLQEELAALEIRLKECTAAKRRDERLRRVMTPARQRQELLQKLERENAVVLPLALEEAALAALAQANKAEHKRALAEAFLVEKRQRLEALTVDQGVLAAEQEIEELPETFGAVSKGLEDLPRRETKLAEGQRRIEELRGELSLTANDSRLPTRLSVSALRALIQARLTMAAKLATQNDGAEKRAVTRKRLAADLAAMECPTNSEVQANAVRTAERLGEIDDLIKLQLGKAAEAERQRVLAFERLVPWTGSSENLDRLVLPGDQDIDVIRAQIDQANSDKTQAARDALGHAQSLEQLALRRNNLSTTGQAVSSEALACARDERDAEWRVIKEAVSAPLPVPLAETQSNRFELTITNADTLADLRFSSADASAQLAQLDSRAQEVELSAQQALNRQTIAEAQHAEALAAWRVRLEKNGLPAIDIHEFRDWATRRQTALGCAEAARQAQLLLQDSQKKRQTARQALCSAFPTIAIDGDELGPVLGPARKILTYDTERRARFEHAMQGLAILDGEIAADIRQTETLNKETANWRADWDKAVGDSGLVLPTDAREEHLQVYDELRSETEQVAELERRITTIKNDALLFKTKVTGLAQRLLEPDQGRSIDQLVKSLRSRLAKAQANSHSERTLRGEIDEKEEERLLAENELAATLASLKEVRQLTGADDRTAISIAISASQQRRELEQRRAAAEDAILQQGDGLPLEELVTGALAEDADALAARSQVLEKEISTLNAEINTATRNVTLAQSNFEKMDSGDRAIAASADKESALAEIGVQADAYLLKRAQFLMLRWSMERYRERRQNPLLLRAAELFRSLTLNRYTKLTVDYDAAAPRLLALSEDGNVAVGVERMSEGTVDQLYLALRIAAVEQGIGSGVALPFLADDLFINFDDDRARAGLKVLSDLSRSTQILFFTHHRHLVQLAREVLGEECCSVCELS